MSSALVLRNLFVNSGHVIITEAYQVGIGVTSLIACSLQTSLPEILFSLSSPHLDLSWLRKHPCRD